MQKTNKKTLLIGITGNIGSGKSTVSRLIRSAGYTVLSADEFAREVVAPGSPALAEISSLFGTEALQTDGSLNRAALRTRIAANPDLRKKLEAITHPRIKKLTQEKSQAHFSNGEEIVFYEAPLLFEASSEKILDAVICVHAPEELLVQRALARDGGSEQEIKKLLAAQMPQAEKIKRSDFALENSQDQESLKQNVLNLLSEIKKKFGI